MGLLEDGNRMTPEWRGVRCPFVENLRLPSGRAFACNQVASCSKRRLSLAVPREKRVGSLTHCSRRQT